MSDARKFANRLIQSLRDHGDSWAWDASTLDNGKGLTVYVCPYSWTVIVKCDDSFVPLLFGKRCCVRRAAMNLIARKASAKL